MSSMENTSRRATIYLFYHGTNVLITLVSPGMSIGYSAVALPLLTKNDTLDTSDTFLHDNQNAATWFASMVGISGIVASVVGPLCMTFGRKFSLAFVGFTGAAGWLITATSCGIPQILMGRFITGVGTGLVAAPSVVYITEIAAPKYRLLLVNGTSLTIAVGIMLIYAFGYLIPNWRILSIISMIVSLLSGSAVLLLLPESPVWLLQKNRQLEAKISLMKVRGLKSETTELHDEFNEMLNSSQNRNKETDIPTTAAEISDATKTVVITPTAASRSVCSYTRRIFKITALSEVWKPFIILNTLFFFTQFCGIYVIIAYAVDVVTICGILADPFLVTAVIGIIQLMGTFTLVCISTRLGVRPISLISSIGMAISLGILGLYLQFFKTQILNDDHQIVEIVCLFVFVATGSFGLIAIPWSLVGEIYPTKYVHYLAPLTTAIGNGLNFVTLHIYPDLLQFGIITVLYVYTVISIIATIFIVFCLPETLGVPHHEIVARFQRK